MIKRWFSPPSTGYFLFGPRGTGKTTWLKESYPEALWIDLLQPESLRNYSAYPERLGELVHAHPEKKVVILDEVQRVPELLSVVHSLIEEKRKIQFILTGSSSRKLKREGVDLLAGRALLKEMYPFVAGELKEQFNLQKALTIGHLPLVVDAEDPDATLRTYVALYLKEEVQAEGLVRNLGDFSRFLEIISFSHGAQLNASNIARECCVSRKTVENYIQIAQDLLLAFTLPVFTRRAKRALAAHPKFYFFDPGVFRSLRPFGPVDHPLEIEGAALEGLVAEHLRAWVGNQKKNYELSFWRTRSGLEVDFILYGSDQFWAIEVKNSTHLSPSDFHGLFAFKQDFPEAKPLLLYRGKERLLQKEILCIPCEEFLSKLSFEAPIWKHV
ncbi:MAG TPA: ATPase [Parachlamydiales bacterium]|nr:ATPase [Parachlamydiales bacterium]